MLYEQMYSFCLAKENLEKHELESGDNSDTFESLRKGRSWEGYCVNAKGMQSIKNL